MTKTPLITLSEAKVGSVAKTGANIPLPTKAQVILVPSIDF
ncbi:MAG: hypothetical protein VSS75_023565 [Candidatus Parabeggiatoa sp.]|nr:hypothetical protein [Candidatus Parabeggiatoa sp.]